MNLINEFEFEHAEAVNSAVAGICLGPISFHGWPAVCLRWWLAYRIDGRVR